jgi:hypothetical protein
MKTRTLFASALFAFTTGIHAQPGSNMQGKDGRPGAPPDEAIAACQGKQSGASCSFTGRRGETLSGTCFAPPAAQSSGNTGTPPLACRPAGHERRASRG